MITDADFTVTFFDVNGGDGIWIRYDAENKKYHNVLIDGGYGKSYYGAFKKVIDKIIELEEVVDLWIITHIDGDHIGAILAFINDSSFKDKENIVRSFWFNHTNFETPNQLSAISVSQGIKLRGHLANLGIVEESFIDTTVVERQLHGVRFQILSPLPEKRTKANEEWLLEEAATKVSRKKGTDHGKTIQELKLSPFSEDDDIPNGSSIAFVLQYKCFSGLFLADCSRQERIQCFWQLAIQNIRQECCRGIGKNECRVHFKSSLILFRIQRKFVCFASGNCRRLNSLFRT